MDTKYDKLMVAIDRMELLESFVAKAEFEGLLLEALLTLTKDIPDEQFENKLNIALGEWDA